MTELDALSAELRRQLPAIPDALVGSQWARLGSDPRARVATPRSRVRWLGLVFAAALLGSLVWLGSSLRSDPVRARHYSATTAEAHYQLGGGTSVQLDAGARGSLTDLGGEGIRFDLDRGRAVFDVAPGRGRLFRVIAGRHAVTVLGTRFSVLHDPAGSFGVEVERGIVSVQEADGPALELRAGDRLSKVGTQFEVFRATVASARSAAAVPDPVAGSADRAAAISPVPASPAAESSSSTSRAAARPADWQVLFRKRDYGAALAAARQLGLDRLRTELGAADLADLADVARLGGDPAAALVLLRALEQRFFGTEQARQAQFLIGRVLVQLGRVSEAQAAFERYLAANPDGTYSTEAMGRLLELYVKGGDTARSRAMAERYLERAPAGPYQRLARSLTSGR